MRQCGAAKDDLPARLVYMYVVGTTFENFCHAVDKSFLATSLPHFFHARFVMIMVKDMHGYEPANS